MLSQPACARARGGTSCSEDLSVEPQLACHTDSLT